MIILMLETFDTNNLNDKSFELWIRFQSLFYENECFLSFAKTVCVTRVESPSRYHSPPLLLSFQLFQLPLEEACFSSPLRQLVQSDFC